MGMAKRATARNRNKIAQRRAQQTPEMNLQKTVNQVMPPISSGAGAPRNTASNPMGNNNPQFSTESAPLTKTNNPQNVLSSGFQTSFSPNKMNTMKPNNIDPVQNEQDNPNMEQYRGWGGKPIPRVKKDTY
tara:strand:- start:4783 stop:5175 length:393 start_codon:yes stop_codon:yes gene_type:complete